MSGMVGNRIRHRSVRGAGLFAAGLHGAPGGADGHSAAGAKSHGALGEDVLGQVAHRPWPLPRGRWVMTQRWNDLLFAHWPVPAVQLAPLLPSGLVPDTFDGSAWVGVVPFWMDRVRLRGLPAVPGANRFPELNLRTYVRPRQSNLPGVYFFSLDAANPIAVAVARAFFHLPYYWAHMNIASEGRGFRYQSERLLARSPARFRASYRSLGRPSQRGAIEHFLTERYALYTANKAGGIERGDIHHLPWPLEEAEAEIERNELPQAHGIHLPQTKPLLHYARELAVYVWALEPVPALARPTAAAAAAVPEPL